MMSSSISRCLSRQSVSRGALVEITRFVSSDAPSPRATNATSTSSVPTSLRPKASNPARYSRKPYPIKKQQKGPAANKSIAHASNPIVKPAASSATRESTAIEEPKETTIRPAASEDISAARPQTVPHKKPFKEQAAPPRTTSRNQVKRGRSKRPVRKKEPELEIASSSWVKITSIPVLSNLEDILRSVDEVLKMEKERGIIDLDSQDWDQNGPLPLLNLTEDEPWVLSAKLLVSRYYRPYGWRLEFANRSIAHALLQHTKKSALYCAWKPVLVEEYRDGNENDDTNVKDPPLKISDATVRIENCAPRTTVDHMRHILRRYDLSMEPPSILKLKPFNNDTVFLVNFEDASWARAAIRELQGIQILDKAWRLCPYPKEMTK